MNQPITCPPWVSIIPAATSAAKYTWRVRSIERIGKRFGGDHHIYLFAYDEHGNDVRNNQTVVIWGWQGQNEREPAPIYYLNKPHPEPATNIPIERDQNIWLQLADHGDTTSDRIEGLRADMPPIGDIGDWHHHSYLVIFDKIKLSEALPPSRNNAALTLALQSLRQSKASLEIAENLMEKLTEN